ncbi:MAG: hypothetical protein Q8Q59_04820 [Luteolibacter sp.]|nr:hypothetical protein [Luteolibacter sp.]
MSESTKSRVALGSPDDAACNSHLDEIVKSAELALSTLAGIEESAKTVSISLSDTQAAITAGSADIQTKLVDISAVATQAITAKTQIADAQSVIATKSDHIQNAQEHADSVRANLDRALTEVTQQVTESEGLKSRAQSATDSATALLTEIRTTKGSVETDATTVAELRKNVEDSAAQSKGLADKSAIVEERIADYEKRLHEIDAQCADQLEKIEDLLRGATSAGLAHAFDDRRRTFLKPHILWQSIFIGSLVVLVILAVQGLWSVYHVDKAPEWDELLRMWLSRIPLVGALVWLAMHASREAALSKRLEEDYGYKAAIATCFEGFRKEMTNIGKDVGFESALGKLCADTLTTMATPPGRIYDKHALAVTPIDELKQITKAATEAARTMVDAAKPVAEAAAKIAKPL